MRCTTHVHFWVSSSSSLLQIKIIFRNIHNFKNVWKLRPIDFRFALMVNERFKLIITVQFLVSMLVVCFNLHQLTQTSVLSAKYIQIILYMFCMLTQISFYCWYGNEVKLKVCTILYFLFFLAFFVFFFLACYIFMYVMHVL